MKEKFTIEVETPIGWVKTHTCTISQEWALTIMAGIQRDFPLAKLRVVKWIGVVVAL